MNSVQLHLALTHVPVILSLVGLAMLVVSIFIKNNTLTKSSYVIILLAGIAAIPVFLTGEGAEEAVERLPGVSESIIEKHEEIAKLSLIAISVSGLVSLAAFFFTQRPAVHNIFKVAVLVLGFTTSWLMIQTAHLGGQIRHTEARSSATLQGTDQNTPENNGGSQGEDDD